MGRIRSNVGWIRSNSDERISFGSASSGWPVRRHAITSAGALFCENPSAGPQPDGFFFHQSQPDAAHQHANQVVYQTQNHRQRGHYQHAEQPRQNIPVKNLRTIHHEGFIVEDLQDEVLEPLDVAAGDGEAPQQHTRQQENRPDTEIEQQRNLKHRPQLKAIQNAAHPAGLSASGAARVLDWRRGKRLRRGQRLRERSRVGRRLRRQRLWSWARHDRGWVRHD